MGQTSLYVFGSSVYAVTKLEVTKILQKHYNL